MDAGGKPVFGEGGDAQGSVHTCIKANALHAVSLVELGREWKVGVALALACLVGARLACSSWHPLTVSAEYVPPCVLGILCRTSSMFVVFV